MRFFAPLFKTLWQRFFSNQRPESLIRLIMTIMFLYGNRRVILICWARGMFLPRLKYHHSLLIYPSMRRMKIDVMAGDARRWKRVEREMRAILVADGASCLANGNQLFYLLTFQFVTFGKSLSYGTFFSFYVCLIEIWGINFYFQQNRGYKKYYTFSTYRSNLFYIKIWSYTNKKINRIVKIAMYRV